MKPLWDAINNPFVLIGLIVGIWLGIGGLAIALLIVIQ